MNTVRQKTKTAIGEFTIEYKPADIQLKHLIKYNLHKLELEEIQEECFKTLTDIEKINYVKENYPNLLLDLIKDAVLNRINNTITDICLKQMEDMQND